VVQGTGSGSRAREKARHVCRRFLSLHKGLARHFGSILRAGQVPRAARRGPGVMSRSDDERFRVLPGPPKARGGARPKAFVAQVLKAASASGAKPRRTAGGRPASRFGRGRVAAGAAGRRLPANARRVVVKSRYVRLQRAGKGGVRAHLRYIERDGVRRDGSPGRAYGADTDAADLEAFEERGRGDRHQFRFIVSPEDAAELEDLPASPAD
jgi:hypothetical protein